ncbi:VanZ family protein [Sporolactobacillus sp. STCC-11]|uniref:VanZ family protein n=1 Tax=Sporolactobacillus caesalpiniae TaxID=3230362 RepID=UPI00339745D7
MRIGFSGWILYGAIIVFILLLLVMKLLFKKSFTHLFLFSIMYLYLCVVIDYTQFPIYTTEDLRRDFGPTFWHSSVNLIPFKGFAVKTSLLNVLLTMPFGFGLSFIYKTNLKRIVIASIMIGVILELLQLSIGIINGFTLRIVDINDVIFNFTGSMIGYVIFVIFFKIVEAILMKQTAYRNNFIEIQETETGNLVEKGVKKVCFFFRNKK